MKVSQEVMEKLIYNLFTLWPPIHIHHAHNLETLSHSYTYSPTYTTHTI